MFKWQTLFVLCQVAFFALFSLYECLDAAEEEVAPGDIRTLAVMNFTNRNPGDGWDWLEKGLADMLITDLSKSASLVIVERDRMAELLRELELAERGIVDASTAGRVGRICKVDWVLFGSFIKQGDQIKIEAHIVEVETGRLLRVEWVEGKASALFALEKELAYRILSRLNVPLSEDERRIIDEFPTDSIPAFEHYSRSLCHFDRGEWLDALLQCRLAVRDDPEFLKAAIRLAQLYCEVGEPQHALIEYGRLVGADRENVLPERVYFNLGRLLEDRLHDDTTAAGMYQKILARHPEYNRPFDIRDPSQPSRGWDDVGGITGVRAVAAAHDISLRALERLALMREEAGDDFETARLYSKIVQFSSTHGMALAAGAPYGAFHDRVWGKYRPLYWRFVRENRDYELYPPMSIYAIPPEGATVGPDTEPTHGYYKRPPIWLAPPGKEIAELAVSVDTGTAESGGRPGYVDIQWREPGIRKPYHGTKKFTKGIGWQTVRFRAERGVRVAQVYLFRSPSWKVAITLRPWTPGVPVPAFGRFQVNFDPELAEVFLDGKSRGRGLVRGGLAFTGVRAGEHMVEVRWPDGRRASKRFYLEPGANINIFLSADIQIISRQILPAWGSHTYLLADREGRLWLLWDQALKAYWSMNPSQESDLFYATSTDGVNWSTPRRLPVSSSALDMKPILQQDRSGVYWLIWSSSRDPEDPCLWIASSENGLKWSFPRKVVLPITDKHDLARWRETRLPSFAFTIDMRNSFWLIWQGRLFRSEDAEKWTEVEVLKTTGGPDNTGAGLNYFLTHDQGNRLLLLANRLVRIPLTEEQRSRLVRQDPSYARIKTRGELRTALWRRKTRGQWEDLGYLALANTRRCSVGVGKEGQIVAAFGRNNGIFVRTRDQTGKWAQQIMIESHIKNPFHPSVASLPDGRCVVAYSCEDGIVAVVCKPTSSFSFEPEKEE